MRSAAVIFMGGQATRLGGTKKYDIQIGDVSCINRVLNCFAPEAGLYLSTAANQTLPKNLVGYEVIHDETSKAHTNGVLNALISIMRWGMKSEFDTLITTTADTPFLPMDFSAELKASLPMSPKVHRPVVSLSNDRMHGLHAL